MTRHSLPRLLLLALMTLALPACTQWQYELGTPLVTNDLPEPGGAVTLSQVLAQLGPPQRLSSSASGYLLAWEHWQILETSVGFSLGALGADVLSFDWGDARVQGEFFLATFDREHRLTAAALSQWDQDAGGGSAIQPFFGAVSVVDVDDLLQPMPQHIWGAADLLPLPEALNNPSRSDMGGTGIGQRGTPTGVGQQSLEMQ